VAAPEPAAPGGRAAAGPAGSVAVQSMGGCAAGAAAPEQAAGAPLLYGLKARPAELPGAAGPPLAAQSFARRARAAGACRVLLLGGTRSAASRSPGCRTAAAGVPHVLQRGLQRPAEWHGAVCHLLASAVAPRALLQPALPRRPPPPPPRAAFVAAHAGRNLTRARTGHLLPKRVRGLRRRRRVRADVWPARPGRAGARPRAAQPLPGPGRPAGEPPRRRCIPPPSARRSHERLIRQRSCACRNRQRSTAHGRCRNGRL